MINTRLVKWTFCEAYLKKCFKFRIIGAKGLVDLRWNVLFFPFEQSETFFFSVKYRIIALDEDQRWAPWRVQIDIIVSVEDVRDTPM